MRRLTRYWRQLRKHCLLCDAPIRPLRPGEVARHPHWCRSCNCRAVVSRTYGPAQVIRTFAEEGRFALDHLVDLRLPDDRVIRNVPEHDVL